MNIILRILKNKKKIIINNINLKNSLTIKILINKLMKMITVQHSMKGFQVDFRFLMTVL